MSLNKETLWCSWKIFLKYPGPNYWYSPITSNYCCVYFYYFFSLYKWMGMGMGIGIGIGMSKGKSDE